MELAIIYFTLCCLAVAIKKKHIKSASDGAKEILICVCVTPFIYLAL